MCAMHLPATPGAGIRYCLQLPVAADNGKATQTAVDDGIYLLLRPPAAARCMPVCLAAWRLQLRVWTACLPACLLAPTSGGVGVDEALAAITGRGGAHFAAGGLLGRWATFV
jgi:hypothetical protein